MRGAKFPVLIFLAALFLVSGFAINQKGALAALFGLDAAPQLSAKDQYIVS